MKLLNTVSFIEWVAIATTQELTEAFGTKHMNRIDAMEFLNKSNSIAGYLTTAEGTITKIASSLCEIKQLFDESTNHILPYTISHQIKRTAIATQSSDGKLTYIDSNDGSVIGLENPSEWVVRYAEIESQ